MPQVFHLGGGSSNFGLDSHLHRVQLGNGSERVVVQMNANGHIEFSNPVTGNVISFPVETMFGNVGLEMNGSMMSDAFAGGSVTYIGNNNDQDKQSDTDTPTIITPEVKVISYPTGMNAADNLSNYPGFTNAMYFNGSSNYLKHDDFSDNRSSDWTFSAWFKRPSFPSEAFVFGTGSGGASYNYLQFAEDIVVHGNLTGAMKLYPKFKFYDTSAWYHIVVSCDLDGVGKIWINGTEYEYNKQDSPTASSNYINSSTIHYIGARDNSSSRLPYVGYMANIQFIDGQALEPTDLGQYMVDSSGNTTSAWVSKLYDGDYGQNGFLLDFSSLELNSDGDIIQVNDTAPKSDGQSPNNWTAY